MTGRQSRKWFDGTTLLAAVLERFAPGQEVTITRAELETLNLQTTIPVLFKLEDGGDAVTMKVQRPGDDRGTAESEG